MARDYARIMTAIWRNKEFCALDESPQRAYLLLVTQPDISAAGVLPLRLRRWAVMAASSTTDSLAQALKVLETGRFIVVDWDAEELLIRSFIRWDGGANNPKRRPVIIRAADEVVSASIGQCLVAEFKRCGITSGPDGPSPGSSHSPSDSDADSLSGSPSKINKADRPADPFPQVDSLSDSDAADDGVVVTYWSKDTTTHNPKNTTPTASREDHDDGGGEPVTAQTLVGEWIDLCRKRPPGSVIGQTSKLIKAMLGDGIDPADIRGGLPVFVAKGLHPSALPSVVNEHMNATPAAIAHIADRRPSTTNARVGDALQLAAKYEEEERAEAAGRFTRPALPGVAS